jgi:hypothetical protein
MRIKTHSTPLPKVEDINVYPIKSMEEAVAADG